MLQDLAGRPVEAPQGLGARSAFRFAERPVDDMESGEVERAAAEQAVCRSACLVRPAIGQMQMVEVGEKAATWSGDPWCGLLGRKLLAATAWS